MIANRDERTDSFAFRLAFDVPQNIALLRCYARSAPTSQVQPKAGKFCDRAGSSSALANLRTPNTSVRDAGQVSHTDPSSGQAFYYVATDITLTCSVTLKYKYTSGPDTTTEFPETLPFTPGGGGSLGDQVGMSAFNITEFVQIVVSARANSQRYASPVFSETKPLDQNASWILDIVFDLQEDPAPGKWIRTKDPDFDYVDSFKLADDGSFEIYFETFSSHLRLSGAPRTSGGYRTLHLRVSRGSGRRAPAGPRRQFAGAHDDPGPVFYRAVPGFQRQCAADLGLSRRSILAVVLEEGSRRTRNIALFLSPLWE